MSCVKVISETIAQLPLPVYQRLADGGKQRVPTHPLYKILDRKPAGNLQFEAPTIASKDFFALVAANTSGALALNHGSSNGYKVNWAMPSVLLGNPNYQDSNGVQMLSVPYTASPGSSGNDEISITFK